MNTSIYVCKEGYINCLSLYSSYRVLLTEYVRVNESDLVFAEKVNIRLFRLKRERERDSDIMSDIMTNVFVYTVNNMINCYLNSLCMTSFRTPIVSNSKSELI